MATIKKFVAGTNQFGGFSPFGNMTVLHFGYSTNAAGAVVSSDKFFNRSHDKPFLI